MICIAISRRITLTLLATALLLERSTSMKLTSTARSVYAGSCAISEKLG